LEVRTCDDGDECTEDYCWMGYCYNYGTCDHKPCSKDSDCEDGELCNVDLCDGGLCYNIPCDEMNEGEHCTIYTCLEEIGCVSFDADKKRGMGGMNSIVTCDDGNFCTTDWCDGTVGCMAAPDEKICDDGNLCTDNVCSTSGSSCSKTNITCRDGTPCNSNTLCNRGCTATSCNDGDACTKNICDPRRGCVFPNLNCDDHNDCTIDICDRGKGCINTRLNLVCAPMDMACIIKMYNCRVTIATILAPKD